jgi:hypothetical protein
MGRLFELPWKNTIFGLTRKGPTLHLVVRLLVTFPWER